MLENKSDYRFTDTSRFEDGVTLFGETHFPSRGVPPTPYIHRARAEYFLYIAEALREREYWFQTNAANVHFERNELLPDIEENFFAADLRSVTKMKRAVRKFVPQTGTWRDVLNIPFFFNADAESLLGGGSVKMVDTEADVERLLKECMLTADYNAGEIDSRDGVGLLAEVYDYRKIISRDETEQFLYHIQRMRRLFKPLKWSVGVLGDVTETTLKYEGGVATFAESQYESELQWLTNIYHIETPSPYDDKRQTSGRKFTPKSFPEPSNPNGSYNCRLLVKARYSGFDPNGVRHTSSNQGYAVKLIDCNTSAGAMSTWAQCRDPFLQAVGYTGDWHTDLEITANLPSSILSKSLAFNLSLELLGIELLPQSAGEKTPWLKAAV